MQRENSLLTVAVMGQFPPPITGAAKNTQLMYDALVDQQVNAIRIETSAGSTALTRSLKYHGVRFRHFLRTIWNIGALGSDSGYKRLYCIPDGGLGVWYTLGYVARGRRIFDDSVIHHRTFQYIDRKSGAMDCICRLLKRDTLHVFLSEGMARQFQAQYGDQNYLVSTNARYTAPRDVPKSAANLVLGHLSNLCDAKGFNETVDTFEKLCAAGADVRLLLAGPVVEEAVRGRLDDLLTSYPQNVEYLGPLDEESKNAFYDRVDFFLFPTKWAQEAQPNVVYEAMAAGAIVISFDRGCIAEMIPKNIGLVIQQNENFAGLAAEYILSNVGKKTSMKPAILEHMISEKAESELQYQTLLARLVKPGR